ncbi:MAG: PilW family protein [Deltaproteobacteria bacterium]|nr:PilW family protein [Deltaproteobacteria bacterium]
MLKVNLKTHHGFTLIELLIAVALGVIVMTIIFSTFKSQHDSYFFQGQVTKVQQNLRSALFMITHDLQMAGHYTNFVKSDYVSDWDDNPETPDVAIRPMLYLVNDVNSVSGIKDGTDILVIIKASDEHRFLVYGESAVAGGFSSAGLFLTGWEKNGKTKNPRDLDGDGDDDLFYYSGAKHSKYGLLLKKDLSRAEIFEVDSNNNFVFKSGLIDSYGEGDSIYKLDVIMYAIDNSDPAHPCLCRKNIGTDNSFSLIAEDAENLQLEFILNDGSTVKNLDNLGNIPLVRAAKVYLLARSENEIRGYSDTGSYEMGSAGELKPSDGYIRRMLSATVKTRNSGH